jgi:hypothetical protein
VVLLDAWEGRSPRKGQRGQLGNWSSWVELQGILGYSSVADGLAHRRVNIKIASVAGFLPSADDDSAPFLGISSGGPSSNSGFGLGSGLPPDQETDVQMKDADSRNLIWNAEDGLAGEDMNADGEDDPDYMSVKRIDDSGIEFFEYVAVPIGRRNEEGEIVPMELEPEVESGGVYGGVEERVPGRVRDMASSSRYLFALELIGFACRMLSRSVLRTSNKPSSCHLPKTQKTSTKIILVGFLVLDLAPLLVQQSLRRLYPHPISVNFPNRRAVTSKHKC